MSKPDPQPEVFRVTLERQVQEWTVASGSGPPEDSLLRLLRMSVCLANKVIELRPKYADVMLPPAQIKQIVDEIVRAADEFVSRNESEDSLVAGLFVQVISMRLDLIQCMRRIDSLQQERKR